MKYSEIRKYRGTEGIWVDYLFWIFSPFVTKLMLKLNVIPNQVTIFMIISGIIGAFIFSLPNIFLKLIGIIFIYLWYLLDCSDGEIARIKKKYSLFGKELDYLAHFINHPLFVISFAVSIIQLGRYEFKNVIIIFLIILVTNIWVRVVFILEHILNIKKYNKNNSIKKHTVKKKLIKIWANTVFLPNFTFIFPITYIIDFYYNTSISYYISVWLLISTITFSIAKIIHILKKTVCI